MVNGHGHVRGHGRSRICGDCEHKLRDRERRTEHKARQLAASREPQQRVREAEVAAKVAEWKEAA